MPEGCQLKKIPVGLSDLPALKQLSLSLNQIKELPENFGNLAALERLDIDRTLIRTLPVSMERLRSLREMTIDINQLRDFAPPSKDLLHPLVERGCVIHVNLTPDQRESRMTADLKKGVKNWVLEEIEKFWNRERREPGDGLVFLLKEDK